MAQKCPDISGTIKNYSGTTGKTHALFNQNNTTGTGVFKLDYTVPNVDASNVGGTIGTCQTGVTFSANQNNSIYTNENLVRPLSKSCKFFIKY